MSDSILQVFVFRDGAYVGSELFADSEIVVGRGDDVDLLLSDAAVAPSQAVLTFNGQQATLLDLTQSNSTQVNGAPIRHSYVTPRDEIHLGPFTLKLKFVNRNGSQRPQAASQRPAPSPPRAPGPDDLRAPIATSERSDDAHGGFLEPQTEVFGAPNGSSSASPVAAQAGPKQAAVPTALIREREAEARRNDGSNRPTARASEHRRADRDADRTILMPEHQGHSATPHVDTASLDLDSGDVVAVAPFDDHAHAATTVAGERFDPINTMGSQSLEVMLDSAFLPSQDLATGPESSTPAEFGASTHAATRQGNAGRPAPVPPAPLPSPTEVSLDGFHTEGVSDPVSIPPVAPPSAPVVTTEHRAKRETANGSAGHVLGRLSELSQAPAKAQVPSSMPEAVDEPVDEEERDAEERPGFNLVDQMTTAPTTDRLDQLTAVEIVAYRGGELRSAHVLTTPGHPYVLGRRINGRKTPAAGHAGLRLFKLAGAGVGELEFGRSATGEVRRQGRAANLEGLKRPEHASGRKADRFRVALKAGMSATVDLGDDTSFHVRFVRPPKVVPMVKARPPDPFFLRAFVGAIAAHFILGVLLVILGPTTTFVGTPSEAYAEIKEQAPRDVEVKPEPEPEPEPVREPEPEPEPAPPPPPKRRKKSRRPKRKVRRAPPEPSKGATRAQVKTKGVLGAMGKLNLRAPGRRSMQAAVSNLDAVKAPGGSNFRIGGLVAKTPTSDVQVGGGGGGRPLTRGSASLLKKGLGQLAGRRTGKVRGRVRRVSARRLKAQGSISREAVARVINEHLGEVQYCYERALLKKPGLKGKLVLEWRISTSGRVSRVRQKMSSIPSSEVSTCIIRKLKKWRFPKPRGGVVVVSYPFIFSSVGF